MIRDIYFLSPIPDLGVKKSNGQLIPDLRMRNTAADTAPSAVSED